jgi:hypothetical protein
MKNRVKELQKDESELIRFVRRTECRGARIGRRASVRKVTGCGLKTEFLSRQGKDIHFHRCYAGAHTTS